MSLTRTCERCGKTFEAATTRIKVCQDEACSKLRKCEENEKRCRKMKCSNGCICGRVPKTKKQKGRPRKYAGPPRTRSSFWI